MSAKVDRPPIAVPGGRLNRLARMGALVSRVAGGMIAEGARQMARGEKPRFNTMLMTPGNAHRVTEELARLRGAAMKVGQLLSMDAGDLIPPALTEILSRLRADAAPMPMSQLVSVLEQAWGPGWESHFSRFTFIPAAAASIGQVHTAISKSQTRLAIKVQYPGVKESIDSDVDNVATLLRLSGLLPASLDIGGLMQEAKRQLHAEANYLQEANWLNRYKTLLGPDSPVIMPSVEHRLTTDNVLAMSWVDGLPIEAVAREPQHLRNQVMSQLFALILQELFRFGAMQTDPNFANYLYQSATQQIVLLDFGATREIPAFMSAGYRDLMRAARRQDRSAMRDAAASIGYFNQAMTPSQMDRVMDLFQMACEPLCHAGNYDFAQATLHRRMHEAGMSLALDRDFWHTPPIDALFIHRKLAGTYLLAARLGACVNIGSVAAPYLD
jgi:predicted unusual protein kinase regulating ubiquinone biosynthesis (AarF/ABC1/UbiB family)